MSDLPADVQEMIGKKLYPEVGEFDVERGYIFSSCASVQNGNPIFWDDAAAREITGGFIAPPSMISAWFRPHFWAPYRKEEGKPMQSHFDLKELMGLPEAIIAGNELVFGVPVRPGDVLTTYQVVRSVSDVKTTKVGNGRFWVIDVECYNQHGEFVGKDVYSCLGYRRPQS